jgi:serine/threonine protein kinase
MFVDTFISRIGEDDYEIYKATKNNLFFALKSLNYSANIFKTYVDQEIHNLVLFKGTCPYLVNFVESFVHGDDKWIVMEYCEDGTLSEEIERLKEYHLTKTEDEVWKIIAEFFITLFVINEKGIAHRDVKDQNIFIDNKFNIKLGF